MQEPSTGGVAIEESILDCFIDARLLFGGGGGGAR